MKAGEQEIRLKVGEETPIGRHRANGAPLTVSRTHAILGRNLEEHYIRASVDPSKHTFIQPPGSKWIEITAEMGNVPITKETKVNLQGFLMGTLTADKPIFDNASSKESHPEGSQLQPVTQGEPSRSSSAPPPPGERVATVPPTPSTARTPESFIQRTLVTKSDGTAVLESHSAADSMLDHVSREQLAALKSESKRLSTSENTVDRERGIAVSELVEALEGKRGETLYRSATESVLESTHRAPEGKRGKVIGGGTAIGAGILVGAALQWYASHHQKQHAPLKHTSLD